MGTVRNSITIDEARELITTAVFTFVSQFSDIPESTIDLEDEFIDLNLDEIDLMDIAMEIEDHLNIDEISDKIIENVETVGEFIQGILDDCF